MSVHDNVIENLYLIRANSAAIKAKVLLISEKFHLALVCRKQALL